MIAYTYTVLQCRTVFQMKCINYTSDGFGRFRYNVRIHFLEIDSLVCEGMTFKLNINIEIRFVFLTSESQASVSLGKSTIYLFRCLESIFDDSLCIHKFRTSINMSLIVIIVY